MGDSPEERLLDAIFPDEPDVALEVQANRIEVKVYDGTPIHGASLCNTCRRAQKVQGFAASQQKVWCSAGAHDKEITFPVYTCSSYEDVRLPSLYEMKEIAWQIVTKPNRQIGFVSAQEFKRMKERER